MEELKITIELPPRTKKNSARIVKGKNGKLLLIPSKAYEEYERDAGWYMPHLKPINAPVNIEAVYYMPKRYRVDLCNLHEALCDTLVHYKVVEDDNYKIIATMDGSRVDYDKERPRTEITITAKEGSLWLAEE